MSGRSVDVSGRGVRVNSRSVGVGSAIPDTSMFDSPIYQWTAEAGLSVSDGQIASGWTEQLAGLGDATANGNPRFRADQSGFKSVEYDGSDDYHQFSSDASLPTASEPFSIAATIYIPSDHAGTYFAYGSSYAGEGVEFSVDSGQWRGGIFGPSYASFTTGSHPTGQWFTIGSTIDSGSTVEGFVSGSSVGDATGDAANLKQQNEAIGADITGRTGFRFDGFIYDVVISDVVESSQNFTEYDTNRV